ncbi:uncharacterized protein LOC123316371 [Coccinella septempunctata]|uniref:uncharacterized protein LOC123316371 n=1 Tax=Coccinella septempunctata TaxID=41139 RepID=UPI001D06176F|nr:uncharacterized protein LOC123316371 [Coccinella septempunctata]
MKKYNSTSPKLYGLRKVHKPNLNIRPIVSCINSPSYNISCFIHQIMSQVTSTSPYNVKNSFEFVSLVKTVSVPEGYCLISLDVISLYTNVVKDLTVKIVKKRWKYISAFTNIPKTLFLEMIVFIFTSSYFKFNNEYYRQIDGMAMGNPASPSIANLVLTELIQECINQLSFWVPVIALYVDDLFLIVPANKCRELLTAFNQFHPRLQFTLEMEKDNSLPFLDVVVHRREDGSLITNWYRKPTSSGRILNYNSYCSFAYKISAVKNLIYRSINLSDRSFHNDNLKVIREILKLNNYPKSLSNKIISSTNLVSGPSGSDSVDVIGRMTCFKFPYIEGLSNPIKNLIRGASENVKLASYSLSVCGSLFSRLKDVDTVLDRSEVIYKIPCMNCHKCYIGQTKQLLGNRIKQHKYNCNESFKSKDNNTALATHHFSEHHNFNFQAASILDVESNWMKRNISEMIYIKLNNTVNCRTDTQNLSLVYTGILDLFKNKYPTR